jgi:methionyl-tRNA synthetase
LKRSNKYIDDTTPWVLAKDEAKTDRLKTVLYNLLESIRVSAVLLKPFIPETCDKIFRMLNTKNTGFDTLDFASLETGNKLNDAEILFQRIETK